MTKGNLMSVGEEENKENKWTRTKYKEGRTRTWKGDRNEVQGKVREYDEGRKKSG